MLDHLNTNNLLDPPQSAYKTSHSTEAALLGSKHQLTKNLLKVVTDLLTAPDNGKISIMSLLDLNVCCIRYHWPQNYLFSPWIFLRYLWHGPCMVQILSNRSQPKSFSQWSLLTIYNPEILDSVLGPVLFVLYTKPVSAVIDPLFAAWKFRRRYTVTDIRSDVSSPINDSNYSRLHCRSKIQDDPKQTLAQWR